MKKLVKFLFIAIALVAFAVPLSMAGIPLWVAIGGVAVTSMINPVQSSAMSGLNQEIWTDVLVEQFRETEDAGFLNEIPDESRWVSATRGENEVINLTDIGADPDVLINNTSYPIAIQSQTDSNVTISLDKYQTKATKVTDDELQYIGYDKIAKVTEKHTKATERVKHNKAIHALAPAGDTTATPVLVTTGADDGTGRKKMVLKDLLALKGKFDGQKIPLAGRVLVLSSDHYNDLLEEAGDKPLFTNGSLADTEGGLLSQRMYGFKVYWYVETPYFNPSAKTKLSFGATPTGTDRQASVAFYAPDMFRANGSTKPYFSAPEPLNQQSLFNLRHYYIVLPRKQRAIGAIVSANV